MENEEKVEENAEVKFLCENCNHPVEYVNFGRCETCGADKGGAIDHVGAHPVATADGGCTVCDCGCDEPKNTELEEKYKRQNIRG
jgi:hypothetical protein